MPSGIDAAIKSLGIEGSGDKKVTYNGFDALKKEKPKPAECTINAEEEGVEKCNKRIKEQEFKIKKQKEKLAGMMPTKKNKPEIAALKDQVDLMQRDGNYRAALNFVRLLEENERDARRNAQEKEQEDALASGGLALKEKAGVGEAAGVKKKVAPSGAPPKVDGAPFESDAEVIAVVRSALDGSEDALALLAQGAGAAIYKSEVKAEVPSIIAASEESISPKLKRAATRDSALRTIRALMQWNPPAVLPALSPVFLLLDEAKIKSEPTGNATSLCMDITKGGPTGKAVPELILPAVLDHLGAGAAGKWKVKVGMMGVLREVLHRMAEPEATPKQLGLWMPKVMMAVRDSVGDARKEVKKEAEGLLRHMGKEIVSTPEIREMADVIISSILDSANMDKAAEALHRMAHTTFMNTIDSCAFGLIFPIVCRAMREQTHDSKMKGVQIVGASVNLIADPDLLVPYLEELMPLLQECLLHPTDLIQFEASKSFGCLAAGLPAVCEEEVIPFLLDKLNSAAVNDDVSEVERRGAGRGLAEVLIARRDLLPTTLYNTILPRIAKGASKESKAGSLAFIQAIAHRGTQAFLVHLPKCFQTILNALNEESEIVTKQAFAAVKIIIEEYAGPYPHLLLPRLQQALFAETEGGRELGMQLFCLFGEKLGEAVKFGQDFLTVEALSVRQRHLLLSSIYIARTDKLPDIRRIATLLWKERVKSGPKTKAEIMPTLLSLCKALKSSGSKVQEQAAGGCLVELTQAGDTNEKEFETVEALVGTNGVLFCLEGELGAAETVAGLGDEANVEPPSKPRAQILKKRIAGQFASAADIPGPLLEYLQVVLTSCCLETHSKAAAEEAIEVELRPVAEKQLLDTKGNAVDALGLRDIFSAVFEGVADDLKKVSKADLDPDMLVHLEGIRMMYGGGHLLLKDTTLELKRGHRYGVVGRNGAGKTTLMNRIASGGVAGMSKNIRALHVRPEALLAATDLNAVQFCKKENERETTDEALHEALSKVGFPEDMHHKSVSELSGGWRMKLLLASAMMRECDLLLLDEPTNHLDVESVAWLSQYLCSLKRTSLMIISHDPSFLNVICTDIIQYSNQRTLDYYPGNFDAFLKHRQISSDEEAEALLMGRDTEDFNLVGEDDGAMENPESGAVQSALLDKMSKISFPLPGTLKGQSSSKPVMELKDVYFAYNEEEGPMILNDISCKVFLTSRIGIVGVNGAGKSTLLNLLCGELIPSPGPSGTAPGEVQKHRNLRLAYIAQQHMFHLQDFVNSSPTVYIQRRYRNGWDEALQERLLNPANDEEAKMRKELAVKYGKYGNEIHQIVGRIMRGNQIFYEVQWNNLPDQKQNTFEPVAKLKMLGVVSFAKAYDERTAAQSAGIDQRSLSQKEIVKHLEQFGLDEEMILNREIGGFSAGQKSKLTLGAAFWIKPHIIALDEPTNYIDMETLDSLVKGLARYKGGIMVISHAQEFVEQVCSETWLVEGGTIAKRTKR